MPINTKGEAPIVKNVIAVDGQGSENDMSGTAADIGKQFFFAEEILQNRSKCDIIEENKRSSVVQQCVLYRTVLLCLRTNCGKEGFRSESPVNDYETEI